MARLRLAACVALLAAGCGLASAAPVDGEEGGGGAGAGALGPGGSETAGVVGSGGGGGQGTGGAALMGEPCVANGREGVCVPVGECILADWAPVPGFCEGPSDIQCCTPIPPGTCDPDAHPWPNAGLAEAPGTGGCPPGMVRIEDFCVDRFEASLVTYPDGGPVSPYFWPGMTAVMALSVEGAVPQGYVDQITAEEACLASGKRLCTDAEWLRACQGPAQSTYPYGDELLLGTCNDHRAEHPAIEYFMTTDPWIWSELGHPCLNQLEDGLDTTGENGGCVTDEGVFDMVGNLHEWTDDPSGTFRGGFYVDTALNGAGCLYATTAHGVSHWDYSTGFRCCADP